MMPSPRSGHTQGAEKCGQYCGRNFMTPITEKGRPALFQPRLRFSQARAEEERDGFMASRMLAVRKPFLNHSFFMQNRPGAGQIAEAILRRGNDGLVEAVGGAGTRPVSYADLKAI